MLKSFLLSILLSLSVAAASDNNPNVFAARQQQGPTCPWIPFQNLQHIQEMRDRNDGEIVLQETDYQTKIHSYASFLPHMNALDQGYEILRS